MHGGIGWPTDSSTNRWQHLWQAWLEAPSETSAGYRFEWEPLTPQARHLIVSEIAKLPPDRFVPLDDLVESIRLRDVHKLLPVTRQGGAEDEQFADWDDSDHLDTEIDLRFLPATKRTLSG